MGYKRRGGGVKMISEKRRFGLHLKKCPKTVVRRIMMSFR
jgi:hypothetical protein